jgi:hypothetical protein
MTPPMSSSRMPQMSSGQPRLQRSVVREIGGAEPECRGLAKPEYRGKKKPQITREK